MECGRLARPCPRLRLLRVMLQLPHTDGKRGGQRRGTRPTRPPPSPTAPSPSRTPAPPPRPRPPPTRRRRTRSGTSRRGPWWRPPPVSPPAEWLRTASALAPAGRTGPVPHQHAALCEHHHLRHTHLRRGQCSTALHVPPPRAARRSTLCRDLLPGGGEHLEPRDLGGGDAVGARVRVGGDPAESDLGGRGPRGLAGACGCLAPGPHPRWPGGSPA
jgi:hypothetical protein